MDNDGFKDLFLTAIFDDLLIGETIDFDNKLPNDNSKGKEL